MLEGYIKKHIGACEEKKCALCSYAKVQSKKGYLIGSSKNNP